MYMNWEIERVPGSRVHRTDDGRVALALRLSLDGEHATDADLVLSSVEAEHLHASLCRALDGHPPPRDAPDCRSDAVADAVAATDAVDAAGALSAKVAEANRRSREAL